MPYSNGLPVGVTLGVKPVGSGMPSSNVTSHPASHSALAAPKPPQPAPTMATLGLRGDAGVSGFDLELVSSTGEVFDVAFAAERTTTLVRRRGGARHGARTRAVG